MKQRRKNQLSQSHPAYPNAAGKRYFVEKALNIATAVVSCMGFLTTMLFFFLL